MSGCHSQGAAVCQWLACVSPDTPKSSQMSLSGSLFYRWGKWWSEASSQVSGSNLTLSAAPPCYQLTPEISSRLLTPSYCKSDWTSQNEFSRRTEFRPFCVFSHIWVSQGWVCSPPYRSAVLRVHLLGLGQGSINLKTNCSYSAIEVSMFLWLEGKISEENQYLWYQDYMNFRFQCP
jgi:hypothetical protein